MLFETREAKKSQVPSGLCSLALAPTGGFRRVHDLSSRRLWKVGSVYDAMVLVVCQLCTGPGGTAVRFLKLAAVHMHMA